MKRRISAAALLTLCCSPVLAQPGDEFDASGGFRPPIQGGTTYYAGRRDPRRMQYFGIRITQELISMRHVAANAVQVPRTLEGSEDYQQKTLEGYAEAREHVPESYGAKADECMEIIRQAIKVLEEAVPLSKKSRMTRGEVERHNEICNEGSKLIAKADQCMKQLSGPRLLGEVDDNGEPDPGPLAGNLDGVPPEQRWPQWTPTPYDPQRPYAKPSPRIPGGAGEYPSPPPAWGTNPTGTPTGLPTGTPTPLEGRIEKGECSLLDFAHLTDVSQHDCPIMMYKVKNPGRNDAQYLLVLSGVELAGSHGVQTFAAAQDLHGYTNDYREAIIDALFMSRIPPGSRVGIIGYSFGGIAGQNVSSPNFPSDQRAYNLLGLRFPWVVSFGSPIPAFDNSSTRYIHVEVKDDGDPVLRATRFFLPTNLRPDQLGTNHQVIRIGAGYTPGDQLWENHFRYWTSEELDDYTIRSLGLKCPDFDQTNVLRYAVPRFRTRPAGSPKSFQSLPQLHEDVYSIGSWAEYWEDADQEMRNKYAEEVGIAGMDADRWKHGYTEILSPHAEDRTTARQGMDALYDDHGTLVVAEAKGVSVDADGPKNLDEILSDGYGHRQATILWAQEAAMRMSRSYPMPPLPGSGKERMTPDQLRAEKLEKDAAAQVISALRSCGVQRVRVEVFVTEHMRGVPIRTRHYITDRYPPSVDGKDPDFGPLGNILSR